MSKKVKQKLLILFYRPPYPITGGDKIRMHQNLKILSKQYNIDVLFINNEKTNDNIKNNILEFANNIFIFEFKKYKFYLVTFFGFLLNKRPLQVNYYYFKKIQKWIDKHINNYEIVFCHTIRTAEYVKNKPMFKIIDFVDAISMNYEKAANKSSFGLWKLLYNIDKKRVLKYELNLLNLFDKKIIISDVDRKYILSKSIKPKNINIVQNAVDIKPIKPIKEEEEYIVFVGKMNYEPNVSAVKYFSSKVFPKILEKFPNLKFYIVGVFPTKKVKELSGKRNIQVFGYVEDLDEIITNSKLVVAPMISGAGIQNKILMAMALGKCVLTTEIGAEGLNKFDKENNKLLEIGNTAEELTLKTIILLQNDKSRSTIGINGYNYIKNHFSFNKVEQDLLSVIDRKTINKDKVIL